MSKILSIDGMSWMHFHHPSKEEIKEIVDTYDVHELIEDDIAEKTTQDKIDVYDDCIFLVLHFPKYDKKTEKYLSNEFNIILGKDFIISVTKYHTNHIESIREEYNQDLREDEDRDEHKFKLSPYYILYMIIDVMYDKVLLALHKFNLDLSDLEEDVFDESYSSKELLEKMLLKKRNIVFLKHLVLPQVEIIEEIQKATMSFYGGDLDVYFEDLQYKTDKILSTINITMENTESLSMVYNTLANIKTNSIISLLTVLTIIIGIMTMISGLYGMNVRLPGENNPIMFPIVLGIMLLVSGLIFFIVKKKKWI
ncbi:MAG: CorA family divalent cation transporter [Candidatus Absconditabacteria bacterium]|nr:CorA family divalent cation transporter [Candidatus Absconditabacteria bacterium]